MRTIKIKLFDGSNNNAYLKPSPLLKGVAYIKKCKLKLKSNIH